jgi:hypothetical protein
MSDAMQTTVRTEFQEEETECAQVVCCGWLLRREKNGFGAGAWFSRWVELDSHGSLSCFDKGTLQMNLVAIPYKNRLVRCDLLAVVAPTTSTPSSATKRSSCVLNLDVRACVDEEGHHRPTQTMSFRATNKADWRRWDQLARRVIRFRLSWIKHVGDVMGQLKSEHGVRRAANYLVLKSELREKLGRALTKRERALISEVLQQQAALAA